MPDDLVITGGVLHLPDGRVHKVAPEGRVQIPATLCHLDVDDIGLAIPWIMPRRPDGSIDEHQQARRVFDCLRRQLCGLCSFDLDYRKCFHVTAADEATARDQRIFTTPAMHLPCSEYADDAYGAATDDRIWWRYHCRDYKLVTNPQGEFAAKAAPATKIERLTPDG